MSEVPHEQTPVPLRKAWLITGLIFIVALINYFDRQSLSVVAPRFQAELHLTDLGYAHIVSLFLSASAIAYALAGFIADWLGTRRSMALFVGWWSLAEASTAFATATWHLGLARFLLGLGEPGLWVAAPKAVGEVFSERRRGLAVGIYSMGATAGAVIALPAIAAITTHLPWRSIFLIDGVAGLLWLPFWFWFFGRNTVTTPAVETPVQRSADLRSVLTRSSTWKLLIARGITDPVWYFYLFWFPKYLLTARGLTLAEVARTGWVVYLGAGLGTLLGGLFSGWLIRRGHRVGVAYRWTMLFAALVIPFSPLAALVSSSTLATLIAAVIALAHMSWLVTITATIIELYPPRQVGKAAGLIAAGSGFGGMLSSELIGRVVTHHGYTPLFFLMAVLHPLALLLIWQVFTDQASQWRARPAPTEALS